MKVYVKHSALRVLSAFALIILISGFPARPVFAGCLNPTGAERDIVYNADYHTYQACNGTSWTSLSGGTVPGGGGGCSNPTGAERDWRYNGDYHTYQFCNGTNWVTFAGASGASSTGTGGYFVLSKSTWNGNLGTTLANIDAKCLTELTTNTNWKGYADANTRGLLVAAKVHAFICLGSSACNNLTASTTYTFANANDSNLGGASFTTDGTGAGPGDSTQWSGAAYFGGEYLYWSDRGFGTATAWGTSNWSSTAGCYTTAGWDTGTNAKTGSLGDSNYDYLAFGPAPSRWNPGGITNVACNNTEHLVCYVNP